MDLQQFSALVRLAGLYRSGSIGTDFIARYLAMSRRHVQRLLKNRPDAPEKRQGWNRLPETVIRYLVMEKRDRPGRNCQWLAELASDRFSRPISRSSVWRILKAENLLRPSVDQPVLRKRFESAASGDLVQMDTSWGYWLGGRRLYLILLLDDHSRMILHGRFFLEETLWHNMTMVRETVEAHGKFKVLYTDNASWFRVIRHNRSIYQRHSQTEYESDIARSCRELGMVHAAHRPYEPQGKGKIERIFRFIQERFVGELDDPHMELWLVNKKFKEWVAWYNDRHVNRTTGQKPKERFDATGFKPLSAKERSALDDIFCIRETRVVDKCNEFGYQGRAYRIPGLKTYAHQTIQLRVIPGRKIRAWHDGRFVCEFVIA
jgi:putative transposase